MTSIRDLFLDGLLILLILLDKPIRICQNQKWLYLRLRHMNSELC